MIEIPLTQGKVALIDDEDYELIAPYKWCAADVGGGYWYALRSASRAKGGTRLMHRLILGITDRATEVDHINGDGLDNRRGNLRPATRSENQRNSRLRSDNTSGYKGVSLCGKRWQASIRLHGTLYNVGSFDNPYEAALAYDTKARELHGEFARLNFA
jgi:hypothetical protein